MNYRDETNNNLLHLTITEHFLKYSKKYSILQTNLTLITFKQFHITNKAEDYLTSIISNITYYYNYFKT